jgi:flavin-binding protein dodecin
MSVWAKATVGTPKNIGDTTKYVRLIGSQSQSFWTAQRAAVDSRRTITVEVNWSRIYVRKIGKVLTYTWWLSSS